MSSVGCFLSRWRFSWLPFLFLTLTLMMVNHFLFWVHVFLAVMFFVGFSSLFFWMFCLIMLCLFLKFWYFIWFALSVAWLSFACDICTSMLLILFFLKYYRDLLINALLLLLPLIICVYGNMLKNDLNLCYWILYFVGN